MLESGEDDASEGQYEGALLTSRADVVLGDSSSELDDEEVQGGAGGASTAAGVIGDDVDDGRIMGSHGRKLRSAGLLQTEGRCT